jgi:N-acyl-phosphatidylethanolamine-hydrolysing phospholipase D
MNDARWGELLAAPHRRGGRYFCPWGVERRTVLHVLRWQLRRVPASLRRPSAPTPRVDNDGASLARVAERAELTWIGHCSFALHEGETTALFDPHFGPRALVPPRWTPPGIPLHAVPGDAVALLSHNHYDHLDRWTLGRLPKSIRWLVPLGLGAYLRGFGFASVRELDWWEEAEAGGWRFTLVPAQHWSKRLSQPENSTLWGAWLADTGRTRLLFGGDSAWFEGFHELGRRLAPLDAALLPVGAYEPRWFMRVAHMNPEEALLALRALGAATGVPMHWGTFDLADDAVDAPPRELARLLALPQYRDLAARMRVMAVGETLAVGDPGKRSR